jgi:hypothetical protein
MSATFGMKNTTVRMFGEKVIVPDNAIAKLMYYLNCIGVVIDYQDSVLTDFQNYDELSGEQLLAVYQLAKLLNPSIFIQYKIFMLDQSLLINADNQFYEITNEFVGLHATREIMIGGKSVKVLKLMACNSRWLNNYYYRPIQEIDTFIRNYQRRTTITRSEYHSTPTVIPDFGCAPVNMTCNYCGEAITTITESTFNIFACFCCMLFNLLYCCVQICSNKNPCCCNINHRCPKCGRVVGEYNSC